MTRLPPEWRGVSGPTDCAWAETQHESDRTGTCIFGGRAFVCVLRVNVPIGEDKIRNVISCAPMVGQPDAERPR